ncbi:AAA family ATPase [Devosia nitrariae]|uniref:ATPase n=1 Tax=Devosia nitrariae TaxID=2071872 RepID=A0ABQ5VZ92_9HYPH|nr:AAA family ATPase [Devosia nitrariae]GLQ53098.1 ATPase [Devosia nitrariae]
MDRFVVISGCSGGGKSTLLDELGRRGHAIVEEPGRRIVAEELQRGGTALPWLDATAFARRLIDLSLSDRAAAEDLPGWVFFDRGLIDAAAGLAHLTGEPALDAFRSSHRNNRLVFLTPPWPEIYVTDNERRHGLSDAVAEYERLTAVYPSIGYDIRFLPKVSVAERADFVLSELTRS